MVLPTTGGATMVLPAIGESSNGLPVAGRAAMVLPAIGESSNGFTGGRQSGNGSTGDRCERQWFYQR